MCQVSGVICSIVTPDTLDIGLLAYISPLEQIGETGHKLSLVIALW